MNLLTKEQQKSNENEKICKGKLKKKKHSKNKKYYKNESHCHYAGEHRNAVHSICNLTYSVPKEIYIVFHNGSNYDHRFIIKQPAEEFEGQFNGLEENTEKCLNFSVPIEKEVIRIDKIGKETTKTTTYRLKFIDSV